MTIAELIASLALDFEDRATAKAEKAARSLESALKGINIAGAIKGDPFSRTYKYIDSFRSEYRKLAKDIGEGLDFKIKGGSLPGFSGYKSLIASIEKIKSSYGTLGRAAGDFNRIIVEATSTYDKFGKEGVTSSAEIQSRLSVLAGSLERVKRDLSVISLGSGLDTELKSRVIPAINEMINALRLGNETSKTAFSKAVDEVKNLGTLSKASLIGLRELTKEFDTLNKQTEQLFARKAIAPVSVKQFEGLGALYTDILSKIGQTRGEISKTLTVLSSEFKYIPRIASQVRNQIISLSRSGYDLNKTEVENIRKVIQYRDIELESLKIRANLIRSGLASQSEVVSFIQRASDYSQRYNISLKEVLSTLNIGIKDWASFYAESLKSESGVRKIRSELDIINTLLEKGVVGNKAITTEVISTLRARQKELQIEEQIKSFDRKRLVTLQQMIEYYDLMAQKSRLSIGTDIEAGLKSALRTLAEINIQLENRYNIESNISKLRTLIAESYTKDLDVSKLIEASGVSREEIEQSILIAREQAIKVLQLQYELGLLTQQGQAKLRDELLQQVELTNEQKLILGKINTELETEKSAYSLLVAEQEKLNTLITSQSEYIANLSSTGASEKDIANAERVLKAIQERKKVIDETLKVSKNLGDLSDKTVRNIHKEVTARREAESILKSITNEKIKELSSGLAELRTVAELRNRERQVLDILKNVTKYLNSGGVLTSEWTDKVRVLEKTLGRVRVALRKAEASSTGLAGSMGGATSALSGFLNLRLVGVFLLYRTLWELRRVFSDVAKTVVEVEDKMKQFQTITLSTTKAVKEATDITFELSKQYALAVTDIADALIKIGQAGYTAQESIALISSTSQLAVATGSELSDTVNLMLSAMSAWNLETSQAADVSNIFTSAVNSTRLTVEKLNTAFNYITGIAPQMNISLEETAAILGTMADAGIRASTSGTSFRAMLAELTKPSKRVIQTLSELGLTIEDVDPQLNSITDILIKLKNAGFSASDAFRAFGRRGASGIAVLVANAEKVSELSTSFNNYARAVSLAAIASESLQARLTRFWNEVKASVAPVVPLITHLIDTLTGLRKIEIDDKGMLRFTKTVGEIVLEVESANKQVKDSIASFREFNQAVYEIKSLEKAGLYVQALSEAYKKGLIPLERYNALMKEYNRLLRENADTTPAVKKVQEELNTTFEKAVKIETVRRVAELTQKLEEQAKANNKLKQTFLEQNKTISAVLSSFENIADTGDRFSEIGIAFSDMAQSITGDGADLGLALDNIQKLLGNDLADKWIESLRSQNTEVTGISANMSKRLYEVITVLKNTDKTFTESFVKSGKTINDYRKSIEKYIETVKAGGNINELLAPDKKNIQELAKYPTLFSKIALSTVESVEDFKTLKEVLATLPVESEAARKQIESLQKQLDNGSIKAKAMETSIRSLEQQFVDFDKQTSFSTERLVKTIDTYSQLSLEITKYKQKIELLSKAQELASKGYLDYNKKISAFQRSQATGLSNVEAARQRKIFTATNIGVQARLALMKNYYNKLVKLAGDNAYAINEVNKWRKQQEINIYNDLSNAALKYKRTLERAIQSETGILSNLYSQLNQLNVQLQQSSADSERQIAEFDRQVKAKIASLKGQSKSTSEIINRQIRDTANLIDNVLLASSKVEYKTAIKEAEQALRKLQQTLLSAKDLSALDISNYSTKIKRLMEDLQMYREDQIQEEKKVVQNQIEETKKSIQKLSEEMTQMAKTMKDALSKQGELKIKDNIDSEIIPKFNDLIDKISSSSPEFNIQNNLDDMLDKLKDINTELDKMIRKKKEAGNFSIGGVVPKTGSTGLYLPGYGGGDKIPAMLEAGEVVIRKEVVKSLGLDFFRDLNMNKLPTPTLPKFATGGLVESKPRDLVTVNLNLGGNVYPLMGERQVAEMLVSHIEKERLMTI